MQSNEVKMFPSTKGVAPKRRELFAELWKELKQLATLCKDQSANHMLILKQLENFENPGGVQPNVENTPTKGNAKRSRSNSNLSATPMIVEEDKPSVTQAPKSDPIQPSSQLDVFSSEKSKFFPYFLNKYIINNIIYRGARGPEVQRRALRSQKKMDDRRTRYKST